MGSIRINCTNGKLRLQIGSPAIDAGENIHITDLPADLDGNLRIADGDFDGIPIVDMGAYEKPLIFFPLIYR